MFSLCPDVLCQHGLVRMAGKSITYMQQQRHHMTVCCINLPSFVSFYFCPRYFLPKSNIFSFFLIVTILIIDMKIMYPAG